MRLIVKMVGQIEGSNQAKGPYRAADIVVSILLEVQSNNALRCCLKYVFYILLILKIAGTTVINIQDNCRASKPKTEIVGLGV